MYDVENVEVENSDQNNNGELPHPQPQEMTIQLNLNITGEFTNNTLLDVCFQKLIESATDTGISVETKIAVIFTLSGFLKENPKYLEKLHSFGVLVSLFNQIIEDETPKLIEEFIKLLKTVYMINPHVEACCSESLAPLMYLMVRYKDDYGVLLQIVDLVTKLCEKNTNEMQRSSLLTILDTCLIASDKGILCETALIALRSMTSYSYIHRKHFVTDIIDSGICRRVIAIIEQDNDMIANEEISLIIAAICVEQRGCWLVYDSNILPKIHLMFESKTAFVRERGMFILRLMTRYQIGIERICDLGYMQIVWVGISDSANELLQKDSILTVGYFTEALDFNGRVELVKEGRLKDISMLIPEIKNVELVKSLMKSLELLNEAAEDGLK